MAGSIDKNFQIPGGIDHWARLFSRGPTSWNAKVQGTPDRNFIQGWVTSVNIYTQTVGVQLTGSIRSLEGIPYNMGGGQGSSSGRHPHRGDLAWLIQIPTANPVKSWTVWTFVSCWQMMGHFGELMITDTPDVWNYPFHPLGLPGEAQEASPWLGRRVTSVFLEDVVRDGQQRVLDPVGHQLVDNLIGHQAWAAGVLSQRGPVQRNVHADYPRLPDDTQVEYFTRDNNGTDNPDWQTLEFADQVENMSPLVEDAHVLYEYSDLLPLGGFDRWEAQGTAPYGQKPLVLYGHGTFITPVTTLRVGDAPNNLKFGLLQVPKVFDDETARASHIQWEDKTAVARPQPNTQSASYDPVVSWTILPSPSSAAGDAFVCMHRSGRVTLAFGKNEAKQSLDAVLAGRAKVIVGKDDDGHSLILNLEGDAKVMMGTADDGVTALLSSTEVDLQVRAGGVNKTHFQMNSSRVNINDGALTVDV